MIIYIKANKDIELETKVTADEFLHLIEMQDRGDIVCQVSVSQGYRVGFIPFDDIDIVRTLDRLQVPPSQMQLDI